MKILLIILNALLICTCPAGADIYKFDIGNTKSAIQDGFIQVVPGVWTKAGEAAFLSKSQWAEYEYLEFSIYTESSRTNLPNVPLGLNLYMPDKEHSFQKPLKELQIGQWIDFKIPLKELLNPASCTEMQFYLSESEYKDNDTVDFWIDRLVLTAGDKTAAPFVIDDCGETAVSKWSAAEATCTADSRHIKSGKTALRFHVDIDWKSGEAKYPVGWPRINKNMPGGLSVRDTVYDKYEDDHNGRSVPPPVWTCPLSQDSAVSDHPAEFTAPVKPGQYNAWVLCGVSQYRHSQLFDFEISSGSEKSRVQFENPYQYRHIFFKVNASDGVARITFKPNSIFAVCGIVLWPDDDDNLVQKEVIAPVKQVTDFLPPEELKKWMQEQPKPAVCWPSGSDKDKDRGYSIFQKHWAECVYPGTVPYAEDLNPELKAFASIGEYEPLTFTIHPHKSFPSVNVTVSDLKCELGRISSSAIDVRRVRYMNARPNYTVLNIYRVVPDVLMPFEPGQLTAGENTRIWLTIHVPDNAKAGLYKGSVTVAPEGARSTEIPIVFRVLPFKLAEDPDKIYGIYYHDALDDWNRAVDSASKEYYLRKSAWELQDMAAHGTRNVTTGLWCEPEKPGKPGIFNFNSDLMEMKVAAWRRHGFKPPFVLSVNAEGIYAKHVGQRPGSHLKGVKIPPPEYGEELTRMCRAIEAERITRGWPEFLYYPVDEPSINPDAIAFMVETLKAVRNAGVKTYVTADPANESFAPLKPYVDVWCTQPFLPSRDIILADKAARKVDYWCYPNHVNGENDHTPVNGARMTYGFGFWRSGFTTLIPWIYRADIGNPWNYLDGSAMDFFNRTEDNGRPIPVAMWEAYREGYDDYRYIYTLKKMISKAEAAGKKAQTAAKEAEADLDYIWNQIRVQAKYKHDNLWSPRETDAYRWLIAQHIMKLYETE